ncbi:TetR family transcriptional regulator [Ammoniphilus sp. CFH 90114]|uniref:TetR family transcriptional regulator n=1 Tax=Ammoniphilus sp. CFH 90114 TaxID=2493665 RepID=UPI00100F08AD|nr:TetR family transcriptional regulator [Ammoniphilus sp. CFH 90114]RXT01128.1 TetR/AcrR family transcriptional regulator [Ammoniphilus sp. CFH 90114]
MTEADIKMRILLAAKKLFAMQGFEGTSVRQICEEAGGNVALVSYHFGGKENVLFAIFESLFPGQQLPQYEEDMKDPVKGLRIIVEGVIRFKTEDPELAAILDREINMQTPRLERISSYVFPVWRKLRELLENGREQGVFQFRSLDHTLLFVMGCMIFPKCNTLHDLLLTERDRPLQEVIDDTLEFVLNGIGYRQEPK